MRSTATKAEFDEILFAAASAGRVVFVDFTAQWCGPCQHIAPAFDALAAEFSWCDFLKVDVDVNQETAMACGVSAMPTFKVFRDSREVGMLRGASMDGLRQLVEQHAGSKPVARDLAAERAARQVAQREALAALLAVSDKERVRAAFATLNKIVSNILADPSEPKYRSLKVDNKAIKEKVLACPGGRAMLLSVGFQPQVSTRRVMEVRSHCVDLPPISTATLLIQQHVGEIARPELLVLPADAELSELGHMRSALEALSQQFLAADPPPSAS